METRPHQVVTKDYPENLNGGIMICGINFGISANEERLEESGIQVKTEEKSFFSDETVNNTRFRNRILKWLRSWDIDLASQPGSEGPFERKFFQTNWLDTQTKSVTSNEKITKSLLAEESEGFLGLLALRRPSIIVFLGSDLIEALNNITLRDQVETILGKRSGNAQVIRPELVEYQGKKFNVRLQSFGETKIVCLPHPNSTGLTDLYMAALKPKMTFLKI